MKKSHSVITVDLDAISNNVRVLQAKCGPGVGQMAVVKADAYGHGAIEVSRKIQNDVEWFAVNDIYEAIELRENGIKKQILVFGVPEKKESSFYTKHDITATISSIEHFKRLDDGTQYHLNFDTGMNRLGFRPEQLEQVLQLKKNHTNLRCTGVYSHFATADEINSDKIEQQFKAFSQIRDQFADNLITYMGNTAGLVQCPEAQFDLVRTGIGIYGYSPGEISIPGLKPAIRWKTRLVQVNHIRKSETVSYGATWEAGRNGYIGIIPVGYANGIPRGLSGKLEVVIGGQCFKVAGTITMNYCMIDLGSTPFDVGTEVHLWDDGHTPADWASVMHTIPYEILTSISLAVNRQYTGAGK